MTKSKRTKENIASEGGYLICGWCKDSVHLPIKEFPSSLMYCNNKESNHYLDYIVCGHESCDLYEVRQ